MTAEAISECERKLNKWERDGYDVSCLRQKWFGAVEVFHNDDPGYERWLSNIGGYLYDDFGDSTIVHWFGRSLAKGKRNQEDILYAEVEPAEARRKRLIIVPGQHEVDFINDRKPEFYGLVCQASSATSFENGSIREV